MGGLDFLTFLDRHRDRDLDNGDVAVVHVLSSVVRTISAASVEPDLNFPQSLTLTFTFHSTHHLSDFLIKSPMFIVQVPRALNSCYILMAAWI